MNPLKFGEIPDTGVLNEQAIIARLVHPDRRKKIIVTPIIDAKIQIGSTSIDLRLGTDFRVIERRKFTYLDPLEEDSVAGIRRYTRVLRVSPESGAFVLHPKEFALASTLEYIRIPYDLAGRLEGRSTWARVGLQVHATASFIVAGSSGYLTFELFNVGEIPLCLYPGLRVAQLSFYRLSDMTLLPYAEEPDSKYAGPITLIESQLEREVELGPLRKLYKHGW